MLPSQLVFSTPANNEAAEQQAKKKDGSPDRGKGKRRRRHRGIWIFYVADGPSDESFYPNPIFVVEDMEAKFYSLLHSHQTRKWELYQACTSIQAQNLGPDCMRLTQKHARSMRQEYVTCNERITHLWLDLPPQIKDKIMLRYLSALGANCLGYPFLHEHVFYF